MKPTTTLTLTVGKNSDAFFWALQGQVFPDVADPLEGAGHRDARGGMFGSRFEGHVGLALRWLAGLCSVHRPIPSCNCLTRVNRAERPRHRNGSTPSRARCRKCDGQIR